MGGTKTTTNIMIDTCLKQYLYKGVGGYNNRKQQMTVQYFKSHLKSEKKRDETSVQNIEYTNP